MEPLELVNTALRFASAIILTVAGLFAIIQYRRGLLRPKAAWVYSISVGVVIAVWRWVVLATSSPHLADFTEWLMPFINPISAALYVLIGLSVIVLVLGTSRRRRTDNA